MAQVPRETGVPSANTNPLAILPVDAIVSSLPAWPDPARRVE
jgi:hypothetical protein